MDRVAFVVAVPPDDEATKTTEKMANEASRDERRMRINYLKGNRRGQREETRR